MKMGTTGSEGSNRMPSPAAGGPRKPKKSFGQKMIDIFVPRPGDSGKTLASKILADVAVVLVIAALVVLGAVVYKYAVGDANIKDWQNNLKPQSSSEISSSGNEGASEPEEEEIPDNVWVASTPELDETLGIVPDFAEAYLTNSDFIGWITIPGTELDLPVVKGSDNAYYLDHTLDKKYNAFGVPFADYRTTLLPDYQSDNITVYGHAAANGSYFASVKQYKDLNFYKEHPTIELDTIYGKGLYKVFGFGIINAAAKEAAENPNLYPEGDTFNYHDYNDMTENVFDAFIAEIERRSVFTTDVDVIYGDKILTLSTCDTEIINSLQTPYRAVLFARKVRDGEIMDVDVDKAAPNKSVVMPAAWVTKYGKNTPYD